MKILILIIAFAALMPNLRAEVLHNDDKDQPTDAMQLATDYQKDQKAADAKYRDKQIRVKGVVRKIQQELGASNETLAYVYLETAPNLPLVKIEITSLEQFQDKLKDVTHETQNGSFSSATKHNLSCRIINDHFDARINVSSTTNLSSIGRTFRSKTLGTWETVFKCGDTVIATGACKGKIVDVLISGASI